MCDPARARGGRVGHHCQTGIAKQVRNRVFGHIPEKLDAIGAMLLRQRLHIAWRFGMISTTDYKLRVGKLTGDSLEGFDQQVKPFVGSPLPEGENAMRWVSTAREVWRIRTSGKDSMGPGRYAPAPIFFIQDSTIRRQEHGNRIRTQQHMRSQPSTSPVESVRADGSVFQIHRFK